MKWLGLLSENRFIFHKKKQTQKTVTYRVFRNKSEQQSASVAFSKQRTQVLQIHSHVDEQRETCVPFSLSAKWRSCGKVEFCCWGLRKHKKTKTTLHVSKWGTAPSSLQCSDTLARFRHGRRLVSSVSEINTQNKHKKNTLRFECWQCFTRYWLQRCVSVNISHLFFPLTHTI